MTLAAEREHMSRQYFPPSGRHGNKQLTSVLRKHVPRAFLQVSSCVFWFIWS